MLSILVNVISISSGLFSIILIIPTIYNSVINQDSSPHFPKINQKKLFMWFTSVILVFACSTIMSINLVKKENMLSASFSNYGQTTYLEREPSSSSESEEFEENDSKNLKKTDKNSRINSDDIIKKEQISLQNTLTSVNGRIIKENQIDTYLITPEVSGRYRFEITNLDLEAKVNISLYDDSGSMILGTSMGVGNGKGITATNLKSNRQYQIKITQYSKYSSYTLLIGAQTEIVDISGLEQISGSIEYKDQINTYLYTPDISGRYRFEITNLDLEAKVNISLYDDSGSMILGTSMGVGNGKGITATNLKSNRQYQIKIIQYSKCSNYSINIYNIN